MKPPAFVSAPAPGLALGIEAGRVIAVALSSAGGLPVVTAHAVEPLPPGVVAPGLGSGNVKDPATAAAAIRRVLQRLGGHHRRVALALPDSVGKVSIVRFEKVPGRQDDLEQLIRFQVRKSTPFPIEDAQVTYAPGVSVSGGGREYVVVVARRDVVREYESVAEAAGLHPGMVDLATLNVINLVLTSTDRPSGDWLLVHVAREYATMAILRGEDLIFFRNRADDTEGNLTDLVHQTAMYYEDRLGGTGFERVLLAGGGDAQAAASDRGGAGASVRESLESRLGLDVAVLEPNRFARFADRIAIDPETFVTFAPLIGLIARHGGAA
jgi:Tfp pilus assembly PilM family ATPase